VKKLRRKTLAQDIFDRRLSLDGVKTLIKKYQCLIFNFVDLCSGMGIMWSTTTRTRVNDATAVTFSVKGELNLENKWTLNEQLHIIK